MKYKWQILSFLSSFIILGLLTDFITAGIIITSIAIHEYGHLLMASKLGYSTGGMYFIPFLGGVGLLNDNPKSHLDNFRISIAGPFVGAHQAILYLILGLFFKVDLLITAAWITSIINLFNLLPLSLLDGGKMASSILFSINNRLSYLFSMLGLLAAPFIVMHFNFAVALFLSFIGWKQLQINWVNYKNNIPSSLIKMTVLQIIECVCLYIFLIIILMVSLFVSVNFLGKH